MVLPAMAVGVLCLVKSGAVMGTYSCKNYDENIKSAWEKENSLPGTDGIPREVISAPRLVFPSNDLSHPPEVPQMRSHAVLFSFAAPDRVLRRPCSAFCGQNDCMRLTSLCFHALRDLRSRSARRRRRRRRSARRRRPRRGAKSSNNLF
jgi:hypothetical protein